MKHRTYFLLVAFLLIIQNLVAQNNSKSFIGLSGGLSAPVGNFAKADAGTFGNWNNTSGFAKTGYSVGVEGAWFFLPNIGIGGSITYSDHGALNNKDVNTLASSYQEAFDVDQAAVSTSRRYQALNAMVGPYLSLPYKKFNFEVRAMAGILKSFSTPEVDIVLTDASINYPFSQKSSTASAFGWQTGLGLRYALTEKFSLTIRGDYFHSNGITIENTNRNNSAGRLVTNQPMSWINGSMGIAYSIGR
jgi:opacity protein-like surface antigen